MRRNASRPMRSNEFRLTRRRRSRSSNPGRENPRRQKPTWALGDNDGFFPRNALIVIAIGRHIPSNSDLV